MAEVAEAPAEGHRGHRGAAGAALLQLLVHAAQAHAAFARRGILLRRFDDPPALRFGLPADESGWARLEAALADCPNLLKEP